MTSSALGAKRAGMRIILEMARDTILRRTLEYVVDMAACTIYTRVLPIQFEGKFGVINVGGLPTSGRMAGITLCAERATMRIIINVARSAVHRSSLEHTILVTISAVSASMLAIQLECKFGVIDRGGFPTGGAVTGGALSAELTIMGIVINVAGCAIHRRAFEDTILVTVFAVGFGVLTVQVEGKLGVVNRGRNPAGREMAGGAIGPQLTVMMIVLFVAGETRLRSCFQVREVAGINMAG